MKICEFIKQFDERYPSLLEKERALENLLKRKEELHICDLDCSLIILVMINNYNDLNIKNVLNEHKEILNAALDYLHGKYLESDLIKMTTNEQSRNDEDVSSSFFDIVLNKKLSQECINEINERQLLNEIDLNNLDETQKKQRKTQSDLKIEVRGNLIYSFALSQTKFKIIKEIIIKNVSEQTIKNGRITISSNPKYIDFTDIEVSLINPHQSVSVTEIEVTPHIEDLMQLVERTEGKLVVQFFVNDEEFTTVSVDISYYSYDTRLENFISGSTALFVTPNDTAVKNVLSLVAKEMKGIAGSTSLSGYLHEDKDNVVNQLKALYNVIHKEAIAYLISPASYEKAGQKVRLPHDVLVHKQGNCLDLTILFASCIEQMGLNPFFVEITGHAFVGVFLSDDTFPSLIYTDAPHALEMNSEEENDIIFIECTAGTADNSYSFEQACLLGREHVSKSISDANFKIIDITRARHEGFLPLPINYEFERAVVDYEVVKQNNIRLARKKYSHKGEKIELTKAEVNRFDIWQKKLLDLSKKNQLVNYRPLGKGLQLYFYDLNALYDAFRPKDSENEKKKIYNVFLESDKGNFNFELSNVTEDKYKEILRDFENGRIKLITHSPIQETSLKFFERERRKSFEETGSNILYLAIGFIQYFEDDKSKKPVYAPIILVPINLNRHSIDSYTISGRGEPPFLNISIFEYFRQEFGVNCDDLLTQISFDIDKVDINSILNTVSAKITEKKRTSIVRTAAINIFNFSKAVMWSDVRFRKEEMSKNKVIKSIIEGRYVIDDEDKINDTFDDDNSNPADLAIPLAADSSQIIAIKDCAEGKSFILQGPPGTGKSQTITNMIVNAIYHNKTVLFVAEKMAALEVVQKRLNELCLGKFALEAHSAKADKSSLMAQFDKRISLGATAPSSEEYKEIASKLKSQRLALNRVINLLHKKKGYMLSFYDALVNYLDIDENVPTISFQDSYVKNLTLQKFADSSSICGKLFNQVELNHGYYDNPFLLYRDSNYTPGVTKNQLLEQTKVFKEKLSNYINASKAFLNDNSLTLEIDRTKFDALQDFLREDQKVMKCIPALIHHDIKSLDKYILDIIKIGKIYQKKLLDIKSDFAESILDIDYESKQIKFETLSKSFFIKKFFGQKKLYKEIKPLCRNIKKYKTKDLPKIYSAIKSIREKEKQLKTKMYQYPFVFGAFENINIRNYDFEDFETRYLVTKEIINKFINYFDGYTLLSLIDKVKNFTLKGKDQLLVAGEELFKIGQIFSEKFKFDFSLCDKYFISLEKLLAMSQKWTDNIDYLSNWCLLLKTIATAQENSLNEILNVLYNTEDLKYDLELIYKKSIYYHIITQEISADKNGTFNSVEIKQNIEDYKALIEKFKELTIKETAAIVSSRMPSINEKSPESSLQGILNKAIKGKCRGKSIRQLFEEVSGILTKIFPVFLMSPMSCAQYLSPKMPKFDIVIFDEASQMPTSEAIGAIARGKSLIVVGDSKQMPPASFFQSKGLVDIDSNLDDLESILDDCDVIGMPSRCLSWHYRSKHESLIRFSNAKFYGNNLVTFPSPNDMLNKVSFVNTKGIYGVKKATNEIEAKAIVKEVARRLKSPELREKSIGIVTFSSVQQEMVEDLLQDMFSKHKDLELINLQSKEPIIVKNLENIQGDERDVILLSVCYGPDNKGKMYYRFGPINNPGGEKRLNVAISRARYEMIVFASFEPELLNNMKSESRGAQELANFLKYAKYGSDALVVPNGSVIESKVGIEKQIGEKLREKGYKVNIDVGKSSFRVDVGIINPDNENEYILGVLCDSYSYESALTSKDRNIVQPNALDLLGWNIMRVWSFDYYDNPKQVIDDICKKIEDIRQHPEEYKHSALDNPQMNIEFESKDIKQENYSKPYIMYEKQYDIYGTRNENMNVKLKIIEDILNNEAPISEELLRNRFANAIGATRAGPSIQEDMFYCLRNLGVKKNTNYSQTKNFYWRKDQSSDLDYYRVGGEKPRAMDDVPKEELIVAIKEVLLNNGPIFKEDLKRYVALAFDIKAVGRKVDVTIDDCVQCYLSKNLLTMIDNDTRIALVSQVQEKIK